MVEVKLELVCECGGFVAEFETFSNLHDAGITGDKIYGFYGCSRCANIYMRAIDRSKVDNVPQSYEFRKIDEDRVKIVMQPGEIVRKYS